ncbi:MAG: prepilin peptidase [Novosphingobium sp.]|nr:prepilin peptidase [Novosphingobium sp.]
MQDETLSYVLLGGLAIALLFAAFTDMRRRQIDNWLNIGIALAAPLFWFASGMGWADIGIQLGLALAVFAVLLALFAAGWMGGGDVKLLTALALWITPGPYLQLLLAMSLLGGVLTIFMAMWHKMRRSKDKLKIPYGVAICSAGLWVLATQYWPNIQPVTSAIGT